MSILGLAIETSGSTGSVALAEDGRAVAQERFAHGLHHAARIMPAIDELCRARRWKPADLNEIYVSAGPGSFTGLRIGITLAKTLAFATGARIVAVPSVRVLVENAPPEARHAIIVLDAKRGQIFTARFDRGECGWIERQPAQLSTLPAMLGESPRPVHLLGEGIAFHRASIPADDAGIVQTDPALWIARAEVVAELGFRQARQGGFSEAFALTPIYIRQPEAQEKWEAAQAQKM